LLFSRSFRGNELITTDLHANSTVNKIEDTSH
jgi:hypothetical protein